MNPNYNKNKKEHLSHTPEPPKICLKINHVQVSVWPNKDKVKGQGFLVIDRVINQNMLYRKSKFFPVEEIGDMCAVLAALQNKLVLEAEEMRKTRREEQNAAKKPVLGLDPDDDDFDEDEQQNS
jgi:hypothetical protein